MHQKYKGSMKVEHAHFQTQRKEFEMLHMKDGETVTEYFARTLAIVNKLKALGENMQECMVVEKVLRSMSMNFNYVVCSIEEANDVIQMSVDGLQSSLMIHEQRMYGSKEEEQVLKATSVGRSRGRGRALRGGRGRGRQQWNKETIDCYNCKKLGHYQYEYPNWEEKAHYAEEGEEEEMVLLMAETDIDYEKDLADKREAIHLTEGAYNKSPDEEKDTLLLMAHTETTKARNPKVWYLEAIHLTEGAYNRSTDGEKDTQPPMAHIETTKERNPKVWYLDSGCSNNMSGNKD